MSGWPSALGRNGYGHSLVAARALAPGEVVERFEGEVVSWAEVPAQEVIYVISLVPYRWLIPRTNARYLNHSCDPSCLVRPTGEIVTRRALGAGEELTISYDWADGEDVSRHPDHYFWDPRWTFTCRCGSPRCVGRVDRYRPA